MLCVNHALQLAMMNCANVWNRLWQCATSFQSAASGVRRTRTPQPDSVSSAKLCSAAVTSCKKAFNILWRVYSLDSNCFLSCPPTAWKRAITQGR